jgi:hypothetical protein
MLKDRAQKASALRLCVSKRWFPQLEVEIEASKRLERSKFLLTDIDVFSVAPSPIGEHVRLVFDCKSGSKESAIGRAFWLQGVMTRVSARHGFIIFNDRVGIEHDHRISAADLSVSLLHESEFEDLAQCMGGTTRVTDAATASIDAWERFLSIGTRFPGLSEHLNFAKAGYWMIKDAGEQCRKTVARLRSIREELDPEKREHLAVFGNAVSLFLLALSELSNRLFLVLLRPSSHEEFSSSLLALLYGGYDNLETAQKIRRIASAGANEEALNIFPEFGRFEQLVREVLQAPQNAMPPALLAREMGFALLTPANLTPLQRELAQESPYAPKFALMAAEYLQRATRLPPEFSAYYADASLSLSSATLSAHS